MAGKVTAGLAESNGSLLLGLYACVSLWAWWEVVAAHHRVHDYSCCHLQADCLESGISYGPLCSIYTSMGTFTFFNRKQNKSKYVNITETGSLQ